MVMWRGGRRPAGKGGRREMKRGGRDEGRGEGDEEMEAAAGRGNEKEKNV